MAEKIVVIYNIKTGEEKGIPLSHVDNYVGKGYSKTPPKTTKVKES